MECSANHCFIERSEPTLSFERARITANIRIVNGTRFHLVARVESLTVARISHAHKNWRGRTILNGKTITFDVNNTLRYGGVQND
jgi:hypothetical protein